MKTHPYFRWFPERVQANEFYRKLTNEELGFYFRCLEHAWLNNGLPTDLNHLAKLLGQNPKTVRRIWRSLADHWSIKNGRFVDPSQEIERNLLIERSKAATNAVRKRYENSTNVLHARIVCVSGPVDSSDKAQPQTQKTTALHSEENLPALAKTSSSRFAEFWEAYPLKDGANLACQIFLSVVSVENEQAVFACLARYLASDHVARGIVKRANNWLHDCARDQWNSNWPKARQEKKPALPSERVEQLWRERIAKGEQPW